MSDYAFQAKDQRDEQAEEQAALREMPGLLPLFEAIDFYHVMVTNQRFYPHEGMLIRTLTLPRPLDFVHVVEVWHCDAGTMRYANAYGETQLAAYEKALAHVEQQKMGVFTNMP